MATLSFKQECSVVDCNKLGIQEISVTLDATETPVNKIIVLKGMLCTDHKQATAKTSESIKI